jgi:CPA1 family monovalent cation:H+ antiporter
MLATSVAGVRGALTMAGVMTLPLALPNSDPFPARHLAIFLASSVIVVSLLLASTTLPALLRNLQMPAEPEAKCNEDDARHAAALAAIEALEQACKDTGNADGDADAALRGQAADHVLRLYQHRLNATGPANGHADAQAVKRVALSYRLVALKAERDTVLRLARRMDISDETARKLLRQIDLQEARYRQD